MQTFEYIGQEISHRVGRYVVAITKVREDAFFVETRVYVPMGVGRRIYEHSTALELAARQDARRQVALISAGLDVATI